MFSNYVKLCTEPFGRSAYQSNATPDRLLTNCLKSKASLSPALQQLALKYAICCLGFPVPSKILNEGGTNPFGYGTASNSSG
ncbi:hypothetical protein MA16_Dca004359 [Dendrobium catenatum]|uniref:Uncharacterized protein n=1 Tax=Dendrobium catenatum TaxID=906689 RepID=A0A2I0W778_9ASPA|nr:hypothetical protein MA16_Dca004359 [Dendrobium catenatum]